MATLFHFPRSLSSAAVQVVTELKAPVSVAVLGFEEGQFVQSGDTPVRLPLGGMGLIGPVRSCPTYVEEESTLTLVQCAAIVERLCERFDPDSTLRPAGSAARARHLSLLVFAEATFFPVVQFLSPEGSPHDNAREAMRRSRFCGLIAPVLLEQLGTQRYLCGDRASACDFLMGMPCLNNAFNAGVLAEFPALLEYFDRLRGRESFMLAHGDPDDASLSGALGAMVRTAHTDGWDFLHRAPYER